MKLTLRMLSLWACTLTLGLASTLSAQQEKSGNWRTIAGAALAIARIPQPYSSSCLQDVTGGLGLQAYAGVQSRSGIHVQARFTSAQETTHVECDLVPVVLPDGLHQRRIYDEGIWGNGFTTIDAQIGFSPSIGFLRIAGGGGYELDRALPFVVAGADVRFGSRVRFVAGADYFTFRTPYSVLEEEWQSERIVSTRQAGDGVVWKSSWLFRAGAELSLFNR
jgi:hypothetical protein